MPLSAAEQLAHSTVRIECELEAGEVSTGTGFFYRFQDNGENHVPAIVTNRHVVAGAMKGKFLLTFSNGEGLPSIGNCASVELGDFQSRWIGHPDPNVDLCVMPIAPLVVEARKTNVQFFYTTLDQSLLPTQADIDDLIGLEEVVMVGYPNGLWDRSNNLPIFRKGILATHYKYDWNGQKEFLIDAACFPGSSGSPVLLMNIGSYQSKKGSFLGASRVKLLGVLYAGPQYTVTGEIRVVNVPTQQKALSLARIPNNLGIIIKAEKLNDFEVLLGKVA